MATIMTAEDAARDAVEGMRPNTSRIAHYYKFDVSAVQLVHEILRLPQVDSARVVTCRSEEHTSELQSRFDLVCRLLLEKKKRDEHAVQQHRREGERDASKH